MLLLVFVDTGKLLQDHKFIYIQENTELLKKKRNTYYLLIKN